MGDFTGKIVVVTGGTKGIGLDIVQAFLAAEARVFVGARNEPIGFATQAPGAVFVKTDVRRGREVLD